MNDLFLLNTGLSYGHSRADIPFSFWPNIVVCSILVAIPILAKYRITDNDMMLFEFGSGRQDGNKVPGSNNTGLKND
jgi:hypothetical protein